MRHFGTYLLYILLGSLIGGCGGCLVGLGEVNYVKKSQRDIATPILMIGFAVIGAIGGILIGSNEIESKRKKEIEEEERRQEILKYNQKLMLTGLNNVSHQKYKIGRRWVYESKWENKEQTNLLKTYFNEESGVAISEFNFKLYTNHGVDSGAEKIISTMHKRSFEEIKNKIIKED